MSSPRFAAFRNGADPLGADAAAAFERFVVERRRGQPLAPERIGLETELAPDAVEDLVEVACGDDVRMLERADVIRCPNRSCEAMELVGPLLEQEISEGEAVCSACGETIRDPGGLPAERRYQLTPEADLEAAAVQEAAAERPRLVAVILTALPEELAAVRDQMTAAGASVTSQTAAGGGMYYTAEIETGAVVWTVHAAFTEAGTGAAAAGAADAILTFEPAIALFVGIAGGIAEKGVKLGDVVAATEVYDYDGGKETPDGPVPRVRQFQSSFALNQLAGFVVIEDAWRQRIRAVIDAGELAEPVAHPEPIAAGSKVIASTDSETFKLVRRTADRAVAVEMEGSGFLGGVRRFAGQGFVIRGISDLIDGKSAADKAGVRKQAVANAAAFAIEMLHRYEPAAVAERGVIRPIGGAMR